MKRITIDSGKIKIKGQPSYVIDTEKYDTEILAYPPLTFWRKILRFFHLERKIKLKIVEGRIIKLTQDKKGLRLND